MMPIMPYFTTLWRPPPPDLVVIDTPAEVYELYQVLLRDDIPMIDPDAVLSAVVDTASRTSDPVYFGEFVEEMVFGTAMVEHADYLPEDVAMQLNSMLYRLVLSVSRIVGELRLKDEAKPPYQYHGVHGNTLLLRRMNVALPGLFDR